MPPLHPVMVSLQVLQTTPEATGMDSRTRASSSPDEHGRLKPRQDEPSPRRPCVNETDPRGPCRVSGPPQIIINHGRHAIVASDSAIIGAADTQRGHSTTLNADTQRRSTPPVECTQQGVECPSLRVGALNGG